MAGMVIGGLFNAFAFAGAGFLFSKLNHHDYQKEMHRHNLAQEKLQRAQENFFESRAKLQEKLRELKEKQHEANVDEQSTNESLDLYEDLLHKLKKPTINDYYHPSEEMKHYQNLTGFMTALGISGLIFYIL